MLFRSVAQAVDLPVILYNVPSRTVADLQTETVLRLAQVPGVIGLKDATGDMVRAIGLLRDLAKTNPVLASKFLLYSGNDDSCLALMAIGGSGVISVSANIAPAAMAQMCKAALAGDMALARQINDKLFPLHTVLYAETNPIGFKWAMSELGLCQNALRLPLVKLSPAHYDRIRAALKDSGVLA